MLTHIGLSLETIGRAVIGAVLAGLVLATTWTSVVAGETGRSIVIDRASGNCLSCHSIPGVDKDNVLPGDVGPALRNVRRTVATKKELRARIWNEMAFNANTSMPPFGKHRILTEKQIDEVTDFIWGL